MVPRLVAFLLTLVMLVGLTGAFREHANRERAESGQTFASVGYGNPAPEGEAPEPVDLVALATLDGLDLISQLAALTHRELRLFLEQSPQTIEKVIEAQPAAASIGTWWASLSHDAQTAAEEVAPQLIGNLQGVPYPVRDRANRAYLASSIATLERQISETVGRGSVEELRANLRMLQQIREAVGGPESNPPRSLVVIDTSWPGRAAVALGDLEAADYVSYVVPGMFFTVDGQIVDWTETALSLYDSQLGWLRSLAAADGVAATSKVATVAWMGYETPSLFTVGTLSLAYEGAHYLRAALDGLRAVRGENQPFLSVLTHSYGSTAAAIALSGDSNDVEVDSLVMVGSPGVTVDSARDLAVRGGNIFVGEASWDPVVDTAFHGLDPGSDAFGAHVFKVSGGVDSITGAMLSGSTGHNEYFVPGSESMRNLALIGLGWGMLASTGTDDADKTLALAPGLNQPRRTF